MDVLAVTQTDYVVSKKGGIQDYGSSYQVPLRSHDVHVHPRRRMNASIKINQSINPSIHPSIQKEETMRYICDISKKYHYYTHIIHRLNGSDKLQTVVFHYLLAFLMLLLFSDSVWYGKDQVQTGYCTIVQRKRVLFIIYYLRVQQLLVQSDALIGH